MNKKLNNREIGRLRWEKLKELDKNGGLAFCKNRQDILSALGFNTGYGTEYSWLATRVANKNIQEIIVGFDNNNMPIYEYHLAEEPDYSNKIATKARQERRKEERNIRKEKQLVVSQETTNLSNTHHMPSSEKTTADVVVRYGELVIELNNIDSSVIEKIINKIAENSARR